MRRNQKKVVGNRKPKEVKYFILAFFILIGIIFFLHQHQIKNNSVEEIEKELDSILNSSEAAEETKNTEFPIAELIYQDMSYRIVEVDDSFCKISVKAPNIHKLFLDIFDSTIYDVPSDMDEYENAVNQLLNKIYIEMSAGNYEYVTNIVEVPFNEDGEIEITYELADALYGGLLSLQQEVFNNYVQDSINK